MSTKSVVATYENGTLTLRSKLPIPNRTKVRVIYAWPTSVAKRTQGLLRLPRRTVKLVTESPEFSLFNS